MTTSSRGSSPFKIFFYPASGVGNVTGDGGRYRIPLREFGRCYRAVDTRSTEFVGSVHYKSQKFVASTAGLPGSDGHHDKPIPADFKCEACHTSQAERHDNKTNPLN